jgi:hypothetical protein
VAGFFINVEDGRVATHAQLIEAGESSDRLPPELPWHPLQGPKDASTAFYAVLRKKVRGRDRETWIGLLCFRHGPRQASLEEEGWEEVAVADIGVRPDAAGNVMPWPPDGPDPP